MFLHADDVFTNHENQEITHHFNKNLITLYIYIYINHRVRDQDYEEIVTLGDWAEQHSEETTENVGKKEEYVNDLFITIGNYVSYNNYRSSRFKQRTNLRTMRRRRTGCKYLFLTLIYT